MKPVLLIILFVLATGIAAAAVYAAQSSPLFSQPQREANRAMSEPTDHKPAVGPDGKPIPAFSRSAYNITRLEKVKIDQLAKKLTPDESKVLLRKGTEPAFCGTLLDNHKEGAYVCKLCGLPLFRSDDKFNSGTGWPSFFQPFDKDHIAYEHDNSLGMARVEIDCARCGGHLGHVFDDGPQPTGLRFCLNSASLEFVEKKPDGSLDLPEAARPVKTATAYFAGGCFWGVEDRFQQVPGVINAVSGYQGGLTGTATYKQVCSGDTNHAETVAVTFDPARISYPELLAWFFKFHDPTQMNRQGPDFGTQYRSAVFADNDEQFEQAKKFIEEQQKADRFKSRKIVTQVQRVADAGPFHAAEDYHQDYDEKHGKTCPLPSE